MLNWLFEKKRQEGSRDRLEPTFKNAATTETVVSSDRHGMFEIFGNPTTPSGAVVNEYTAMRVSAVYACVSLISGCIGQLPLPIYQRQNRTRVEIENHDFWWLLNERPCSGWVAQAFWEFIGAQILLRGDGIAYIARNRAGQPTALIPYPRDRVLIEQIASGDPKVPKRLQYFFSDVEGYFGAQQEDVLHFAGFGFNGVHSMSVIQWGARNGIGIAIKGDQHAGQFFSQGGKPQIAVTAPGSMTPKLQDEFRDAWVKKYSGSGPNTLPLILTEGLGITELTMSAVDQQLLESRQWQVVDVARAFGVAPHLIGETTKATSFGTGIESMDIGFIKYTMSPHLKRIRDELNGKLWIQSKYFTEHNLDNFLQGDSAAQSTYYSKALGGPGTQGWMTPNEVRRLKNLPPIEGGDDIFQSTTTPTGSGGGNTPTGAPPPAQENNDDDA